MTDALFIGAVVAFISVMFGFVFLYDRSVGGMEYDESDGTAETSEQDDRGTIPA